MSRVSLSQTPPVATIPEKRSGRAAQWLARVVAGGCLVTCTFWVTGLRTGGWEALGPILGIALVVFSLFGDLPPSLSWLQRLGAWLFPGIALGTIAMLAPLLAPTAHRSTSLLAISPSVWAAYISIVLVGISFEVSALPGRIRRLLLTSGRSPALIVPLYVLIAGLLGNILDGVSIMAISVVILLNLLPLVWATRSAFALLFGGLISNLITVAAEPTNIKFQDVLHGLLNRVTPSYWVSNWPISVLGIVLPVLWLAVWMWRADVRWRSEEIVLERRAAAPRSTVADALGLCALLLLATGIVLHSLFQAEDSGHAAATVAPLWVLLLPAGVFAIAHIAAVRTFSAAVGQIRGEFPVWGKLMIIFALLWLLNNALSSSTNTLAIFFVWPHALQYGAMILLSLFSAVTDNVAVAAMQGSIISQHPLAVWQIRLIFIVLAWAGGFTPFGCLQSLAVNSRLKLSMGSWFRETIVWSALSLIGGILGLFVVWALYPTAVGLVI